ncbi:MAG: adenylate/guanylate cyclase domain-containing protein, partial [Paracoccaceae bacterium]
MERKLAAILAADVVGYSAMMGEHEDSTLADLKEHRRVVFDPAIEAHNGRIIKLVGDGTLVEFPSVVDAVQFGLNVQKQIKTNPSRFVLRIGIHLGDVIVDDGDIYGHGVNVAARLEALAPAGGICISSIVHESVGRRITDSFVDIGQHDLKNIANPVRLYSWPPQLKETKKASQEPSEKPSVAVLPFENMSNDPDQLYFGDGISEDITTGLSRFKTLLVVARNSSFQFRGSEMNVGEIAAKLGVQYLLEC